MNKTKTSGARLFTAACAAGILMFASAACTKGRSQSTEKAPAPKRNPLAIDADETLRQRLKVGEAPRQMVNGAMEAAARVEANGERLARVSSSLSGRITSTMVVEGDTVTRGQVLATYFSTELAEQQSVLLKANTQKVLAERAVERGRQLLAADVIGSAEVQRREADLQEASADAASARDQLLALGMPEGDIAEVERTRTVNSIARILASMDGTIVERKVTIGQVVQVGETAFEISDLSSLWLVADVPEQSSAGVHAGKRVKAEIAAFPDEVINGMLTFVSPVVSAETRTVRARMNLPNGKGKYKPAMLATMILSEPGKSERILPMNATVREDNKEYCFVETVPGNYVLREVELGAEAANGRVLISGLGPHEKVVLDGAFHLNNERRRLDQQGGN